MLDDGDAVYGGTRYHVGDRVTLRRNSHGERTLDGGLVDVANGQLGTVASVDGGRLVVRLDRDPDVDVVLDDRYLARGGQISHGYALTTHRAQGGTWDLSITVGVDGLYREAAYTDLSRGITENWLVITDPDLTRLTTEADPDLDRHDTGIDPDAGVEIDDDLTRRLSTSRSKQLAHSVDPDHARVDALARGRALPELVEQLGIARHAARVATQAARRQRRPARPATGHARPHRPPRPTRRESRPSTGTTSAPSSTSTTVPAASTSGSSPPTARPPSATWPGNRS